MFVQLFRTIRERQDKRFVLALHLLLKGLWFYQRKGFSGISEKRKMSKEFPEGRKQGKVRRESGVLQPAL
jgi:hypothetical protein